MELRDYVGIGQSCAITMAFLYAVWLAPGLIRECLAAWEKKRQHEHLQKELDRDVLRELRTAIEQLYKDKETRP